MRIEMNILQYSLRLLFLHTVMIAFTSNVKVTVIAYTGIYGINYGRIANNLPSPDKIAMLLRTAKIKNVRIYDADHRVLKAFSGTGLELIVGLSNDHVKDMSSNSENALTWVKDNVEAFLPGTKVVGIAIGNEVLGNSDNVEIWDSLLDAEKNIYNATQTLGIDKDIQISTAHSQAVFDSERKNKGIYDEKTRLHYDNLLDAQVDAAYAALEGAGYGKMEVIITETGWASKGDQSEPAATVENARTYNFNLRKRLALRKGTPFRPKLRLKAYIFALFNENLKRGHTSENNYGLYKPDGSIAYDIGFPGLKSSSAVSSLFTLKEILAQGFGSSALVLVLSSLVLLIL